MLKFFRKKEAPHIRNLIYNASKEDFIVETNCKNIIVFKNKNNNLKVKVLKSAPWIFNEIFIEHSYKLDISPEKYNNNIIVFDIGANRGYASLNFATQTWCKKIFSFEPDISNFIDINENLKLNPTLQNKIQCFNIGLSNNTKIETFYTFENRDDLSTTSKEFIDFITADQKDKIESTQIVLCNTSEILKSIVSENISCKIILKVDTEGSEYEIFKNLFNNYPEIFENIIYVCGETHKTIEYNHLEGFQYILKNLPQFEIVKQDINNEECVDNFILRNKNL